MGVIYDEEEYHLEWWERKRIELEPYHLDWVRDYIEKYREFVKEPILDIGASLDVGGGGLNTSGIFKGKSWIGLDIRKGIICEKNHHKEMGDIHNLPFRDSSIGLVVSTVTFEHIENPLRATDEIHRVLMKDGLFIITVPFKFGIHGLKDGYFDYWRYTPLCVEKILFRDFEVLDVTHSKEHSYYVKGCAKKVKTNRTQTHYWENGK